MTVAGPSQSQSSPGADAAGAPDAAGAEPSQASRPAQASADGLSLARFEQRLGAHDPPLALRAADRRRAAVAAVLRFERDGPEVLLMKRAARQGDRWSGHVSLPGGRAEPADPDLLATAVRETREEVGVDLTATARVLGRLAPVAAGPDKTLRPLSVTAYVFAARRAMPLSLGDEAEAAFWFPLRRAAAGELSGIYTYQLGPVALERACWRWRGHVVWGLTYGMLSELLRVVGE